MSKQDRQGVRTPADLEQKYNFGRSFAEVKESARAAGTAAQKAQSTAERANEAAREAKTEILKLSDSITLSVTDGEPGHTAMIKLKVGEKEYTGQIDMQGVVTFTSLKTSGATEINGDNITTGSILADLIKAGVIKSKDGTSVVIDLDEGNVDLTGSIVTQKKQYEGFEQASSVTPSGVTVGDTVSDFYTEVVAGAVRASAYGKAQSIFGVTPVYLDEGTVYYAVLTLRNMMNGNQWLKLSAQPDRTVITGLTAPVDDSDAANKEYVDTAKASAISTAKSNMQAYGLGGSCANPGDYDANKAVNTGFYNCDVNTPDNRWWFIDVKRHRDGSFITQKASQLFNSYFATRLSSDGGSTWSEWSRFNPPKVVDVEYRTVELFRDIAVYAKTVYVGFLPNATSMSVAHGCDATRILRVEGVISNGQSMPTDKISAFYAGLDNIVIKTNANMSSYTAIVTLYYTKG